MGGAFGGKESQATIIAGIAALLAWKARRAGETAAAARRRHARDRQAPSVPDPLRRRLRRRGPHPGARSRCSRPTAATSPTTRRPCSRARYATPTTATGCRTSASRGLPCKTNTVSNTAFRGYGGPQGMLAIETIIEAIARRLGLPVDTMRERNFYGVGRNDVTPYGMRVEDNIIERVARRTRPRCRSRPAGAARSRRSTARAR